MQKCGECGNESDVLYHRFDDMLWVCPQCILKTMGIEPDPQRSRTTRAAVQSDAQAACEHNMVASANLGELCKCSKCGAVTPLSQSSDGG